VPVLAEQTIKGASLIEDGQVLIAIFGSWRTGKLRVASPGSTRANPIGYTVGGQGIIIPADVAFPGSGTDKSIFSVGAQPAVAPAIWGDTACIGTKLTFDSPLSSWRLSREAKRPSCRIVSFLNQGENPGKVSSDAIQT